MITRIILACGMTWVVAVVPSVVGRGEPVRDVSWGRFDRKAVSGFVTVRPSHPTVYSFHLNDAFQFQRNIRVVEEQMGFENGASLIRRTHPRWSSTAFWYAQPAQTSGSDDATATNLPQQPEGSIVMSIVSERCLIMSCVLLTAGIAALLAAQTRAEDWPTYRHDMARSGITSQRMELPLVESWVFNSAHRPQPAWGDPNPRAINGDGVAEGRRVHFDDVFQPVASGDSVFFGSSADNKVYCLDAETGHVRWTRITGGPIRLAPAIAGRRLFVGSDDGFVYCLNVDDGSTVWKFRAAPENRRVLGHGKMISLWPVRTGVVVDHGVA